jgi:hypothetical protein
MMLWHEGENMLNGPIITKDRKGRGPPSEGQLKRGSDFLVPLLNQSKGRIELKFFDAQKMAKATIYEKYVDMHIVQPALKGDDGGKYTQKMVGFTDFV